MKGKDGESELEILTVPVTCSEFLGQTTFLGHRLRAWHCPRHQDKTDAVVLVLLEPGTAGGGHGQHSLSSKIFICDDIIF